MSNTKNKSGNQLINQISKTTTLIFIDFEAFCTTPLYPSEIGCARVQNGQIVAMLHAFMSPSNLDVIKNSKDANQFYFTKKITGIPAPWMPQFNKCKPCIKYEENLQQFGKLLIQFCTANSTELKNGLGKDIGVQIFSEFEQNDDYVFLAKGIDLEKKILSKMMGIENKVVEADDVHKKFFDEAIVFENLHSNRNFDFCDFHKKVPSTNPDKIKHCALDDAVYLAKLYLHLEPTKIDVESVETLAADVTQNGIVYKDDELVIEVIE
ncbi:Conserved_hypothetical protein [Hexamita inflata]|uniref:Exonuclease domain-containing protein n=1 Tax=Hexamita inflata TaxID=28002 RepID=A0ABP1GFK1_9EUKA